MERAQHFLTLNVQNKTNKSVQCAVVVQRAVSGLYCENAKTLQGIHLSYTCLCTTTPADAEPEKQKCINSNREVFLFIPAFRATSALWFINRFLPSARLCVPPVDWMADRSTDENLSPTYREEQSYLNPTSTSSSVTWETHSSLGSTPECAHGVEIAQGVQEGPVPAVTLNSA